MTMKIFRILLHITLVICLILLITQKLWVDNLVNYIIEHFDNVTKVNPSS